MDHFDQVEKAYQELINEGAIFASQNQEEVEKQKALTTFRSAYYINLMDSQYGILEKLTGNNYLGYSVDIIVWPNGTFFDIMTDVSTLGGRIAKPINAGPQVDPALGPRWRQPTRELATLPGGGIPNPDPDPGDDEIMQKLDEIQGQIVVVLHNQSTIMDTLSLHTQMLQQILSQGSSGSFPIHFPEYKGRVPLFGGNVTLVPEPPMNP